MFLDGAESKKLRLGLGYFSEMKSCNCANGTCIFLRYKSKAAPQGLVLYTQILSGLGEVRASTTESVPHKR